MSIKSALKSSGHQLDAKLGGAHLTRQARGRTIKLFVEFAISTRLSHISCFRDVRGKDLHRYVKHRLAKNISKRTIQNELSHLRALLRAGGAEGVANAPELTNDKLGVGGTRRKGTNEAATAEQLDAWCQIAESTDRDGLSAMLRLCRFLGLRGNEALHVRPDTLKRWRAELEKEGEILVSAGTKGGRRRLVKLQHPSAAMEAIEFAENAMGKSGFLIARADGKPVAGLKQARSIWHSWMCRHRIKPHSLRYAFAHAQFDAYLARNFSEREALASLSLDLGHGDGRGRWVKSVYLASKA